MKVRYSPDTKTLTVPDVEGVQYFIDGKPVEAGDIELKKDVTVTAEPKRGFRFEPDVNASREITVDK